MKKKISWPLSALVLVTMAAVGLIVSSCSTTPTPVAAGTAATPLAGAAGAQLWGQN